MYSFRASKFHFSCILSVLILGLVQAEEPSLEPMVVVETRTPQPLSEASPWVTRISAYDLEESQIDNLADALRSVPGMAVVRAGQTGAQTSLFSRGGESNHVTFLYEGRRLNSGFSGTYNLGELSTLNSSSIEVMRGSSSSLYGAHAMGGTVLMRNEYLETNGQSSEIGVSGGTFNSLRSIYKTGFKNDDWAGNFGFASVETDNDRLNSKHENLSSSFTAKRQFGDGLSFNLLGIAYDSSFGSIGPTGPFESLDAFQETDQFLVSPQLKIQSELWDASLTYSYSEDDLYYYFSPTYETRSMTEQEDLDLLLNMAVSDKTLVQVGTSYSTNRFLQGGLTWLDGNNWEQASLTLGIRHSISKDTTFYGNLRHDEYTDFDNSVTYDVTVKSKLSDSFIAFAKHGIGYAPPEAFDLYGIGPLYPGSPDLVAEESKNFEIGFSYQDESLKNILNVSFFFSEYDNLIKAEYDTTNWVYFPSENIDNSEALGIEISSNHQLSSVFSVLSSLTYMRAKNLDSGDNFLIRRPEFFGSISAIYDNQNFNLGAQLNFRQNTRESLTVEADDYSIVRLFSSYEISDGLLLNARIENIFDTHYEEVVGYPALGRAIHAGLRYSF
jgi:vitamin B12 transporter